MSAHRTRTHVLASVVYHEPMRAWIALLMAWQVACSSDSSATREIYDYLVTPAGERFRVISAGPVVRGANTLVGMRITYVAQAESPAELLAHADTLVRALGPELSLSRQPNLSVWARFGPPSVSLRDSNYYALEYRLNQGEYRRADSNTHEPPSRADTQIDDDPSFPFRAALLNEGADAGNAWLAHLNDAALAALREAMTPDFLSKLSDDARLADLIRQRKLAGWPDSRRELYRMQQRSTRKGRKPGDDARVVYEADMANGQRMVERLVLQRDATRWQVSGFAFQPVPR